MLQRLSNFLRKQPKLFVIGLDCAPPELIFDAWRHELPNLGKLMDGGAYGELLSSIPAITVPAWSSMTSSKDPGTLGFYGFRNRSDNSYDKRFIATGTAVKEKRIWDILGEAGNQSSSAYRRPTPYGRSTATSFPASLPPAPPTLKSSGLTRPACAVKSSSCWPLKYMTLMCPSSAPMTNHFCSSRSTT
jgi:predicted AlkP superfamily phosphohydrolase/phosphomutase